MNLNLQDEKVTVKKDKIAKPKVVFTFVEAGMGHIIPMSGLCLAFSKKYGDKCEILKSNIFAESKFDSVKKMGKRLFDHTQRTALSRAYNRFEAYSYMLPSSFTLFALDSYFHKPIKDFFTELKELSPDLIVSSYYLPSHLARRANDKKIIDTLVATYTPDPYIYPAWDRKCDMFIVNNEQAEKQAIKKGFAKSKVKRIPFIYKKEVTENTLSREEARDKLEIDKSAFTVLFTSGAYGAKNTYRLMREFRGIKTPVTLIVICGKNEEMQAKVSEIFADNPTGITVKIIGFTGDMTSYMRSADVIIGKSGMNTVMEAAYLGCPMIINAEANALEEHITKFCIKENLAIREKDPKKIIGIVEKMAKGGKPILKTERKAEYFDPTGADKAADLLFEMLKKKFPNL